MMPACLYVGPIEEVEINAPPTILWSDPPQDEEMVLSSEENVALVVVTDSNDTEALEFRWWVSGQSDEIGTAEISVGINNTKSSKITLPADENLDGHRLYFTVIDSYLESKQRSWDIVYEGGN